MGSLHPFMTANWDHEPGRANVGQASRLPAERLSASKLSVAVGSAAGGGRDACPTLQLMGRERPRRDSPPATARPD